MSGRVRDGGPFEAIADCPCCGRIGIHPLRSPSMTEPEPEPAPEPDEETELFGFAGAPYRVISRPARPRPNLVPEYEFDVIRRCERCGTEWGNR